ncbi:hypothetical protein AAFF_G00160830, partial [Aldrovandia affinis]
TPWVPSTDWKFRHPCSRVADIETHQCIEKHKHCTPLKTISSPHERTSSPSRRRKFSFWAGDVIFCGRRAVT